ncbi:coiled-coil domain-containing protein 102B [Terrapene carolina triunguis]|uniref:coiled-coil domain-containing protein 102B n=1 Tax=Terrapene triunguis TaxID=2587831 RepID=UPI000CEF726C|nr:coiled-coil domain-containing protein 102B [Terrapene carolina triunguis]
MNLDSVHKLSDKTQIFKTQQRQSYELDEGSKATGNLCNSSLPSQRLHPYSSHHPCMHISNNNDWEISEELRLRELEEVKARAAQMEKTMRWWSDCTANWREKWSKVRAERNKAREEGRQLRIKLETTMKELNALKKLNQDLLIEKEESDTEVTWKKKLNFSDMPCMTEKEYQLVCLEQKPVKDVIKNKILVVQEMHKDVETTETTLRKNQGTRFNLRLPDSFAPGIGLEKPRQRLDNIVHPPENELIHVSALHLQLDESQKILQKEREMHFFLEKEVEKLDSDLSQWKWKYEEMRQSKLESLKQLNILHDLHQNEVERNFENIEDETGARTNMDRKMCELRAELERLQSENTSEWGKREILETEKQDLERENRRLKAQVKEIQELLDKRNKLPSTNLGSDFKTAQSELLEKNKELIELQHAHHKLNKQYHDKVAELMHANKRVEQHEDEVKKLRSRMEDLKSGLNQAEDKLDDSLNQIRKLQRSLDEQTEANDNLQIQLNHLKSRLKGQQKVSSGFGIKQSSTYDAGDSTETVSKEEGSQHAS